MPVFESLDETSDYSMFLSTGVSDALRGRALRKLFGFSMFNVRDGLDDYDDDYRTFEALGDVVTSDMKLQAERRAQQALLDGGDTDTAARSAPASSVGDAEEHDAKSPPSSPDHSVADEQASSPSMSAADARAPGEGT